MSTGPSTGTSTMTRSREAQDYLEGVAAQLADLPDEDRADLLDELASHLDELAAESDAPLATRLGTPADYAAELRASAGLPPARSPGRAGSHLLGRARAARTRPDVRAVEQFLVVLRPMWWVVRAWVVVGLLALPNQPSWSSPLLLVPVIGSGFVGFALLAAAVFVSVQWGRRPPAPRSRLRWLVVATNVVAVLGCGPVLASLNEQAHDGVYRYYVERVPPSHGVWASAHRVRNVYVYDAAGNALTDVRLFDQRGRAISLDLTHEGHRRQVLDSQGLLVDNAFPYQYVQTDGTVAAPSAGPGLVVPPLLGAPSPSATAPPGATSSAGPTPSASPSPSGTGRKR